MADYVTKFKHPEDPPTWISHYRGSWSSKRKERLDCPGKLLDVQPGHHLQGYEHKERLEHSTQRQIFKEWERKRERENGLLEKAKGHVSCGDENSQATFDQRKLTGTTSVQPEQYCVQ